MLERSLHPVNDRDWMPEEVNGTVRMAMVGAGWWTIEEAIPAVSTSTHCETTVVVDRNGPARERAAGRADARPLEPSEFEDGVSADEYDAVYVATPNGTHLDLVRTAADQGKDVLCEKPLEASVERARTLVDVCERAGVTLMTAYRMQTEPLVRRARELLADGAIGKPRQVHSDISATLLDVNPDTDQWRLDPDLAGGCALVDLGIYPLNTIRFLLDEDPAAVIGTTNSSHPAFADVDEHVWFQLEFPNGVGAVCSASHNAYESSNLRVVGSEGVIELTSIYHPWTAGSLSVEVDGTRIDVSADQVNQMEEEFDYFATRLLTGTEPEPDGEQGLRDVEFMAAIYESARTNEVVPVPGP